MAAPCDPTPAQLAALVFGPQALPIPGGWLWVLEVPTPPSGGSSLVPDFEGDFEPRPLLSARPQTR